MRPVLSSGSSKSYNSSKLLTLFKRRVMFSGIAGDCSCKYTNKMFHWKPIKLSWAGGLSEFFYPRQAIGSEFQVCYNYIIEWQHEQRKWYFIILSIVWKSVTLDSPLQSTHWMYSNESWTWVRCVARRTHIITYCAGFALSVNGSPQSRA